MYKGGEGKAQGGWSGTFREIHISTWSNSVENGIHTILYYFANEYVCLQGLTIQLGHLPIVTSRNFFSLGPWLYGFEIMFQSVLRYYMSYVTGYSTVGSADKHIHLLPQFMEEIDILYFRSSKLSFLFILVVFYFGVRMFYFYFEDKDCTTSAVW